ncbi:MULTISPECIES: hypothetical protein [Henriciella]|jgi:hypothetical protein|uniref:DUF4760 domain-containing protein n=1 Tax=Henriciella pelagia TaxID=1977912 RepID=A0ABQ1JHY2_9PROT|nr:hypothetical protein [Henriciella pelagia]GGB66785.1 hypothetical protein GCM10011503_14470 [Henriciella pelagia]
MDLSSIMDSASNNWTLIVTVGSAIFAVIGAIASHLETRRQEKIRVETLRMHVDSASLEWGAQVIDILGRISMFARTRRAQANDQAFNNNKVNLLMNLSSMIERGRMFFPNVDPDGKGAEKEGAYRGHRPPILDALVFAYYELEALTRDGGPTGENSANFVDDCRRLVVSELQAHTDPRRRDMILGRYDRQRKAHREDAIRSASSIKNRLKARRPQLDFERPGEPEEEYERAAE